MNGAGEDHETSASERAPTRQVGESVNDRQQKKVKKLLLMDFYAFHALFVGNSMRRAVTINVSDIGRPYFEELFTGGPRIAWTPGELVPEWRGSVVNVPALVENIRIKLLLEQTFGGQISPTTPPDALAFLLAAAVSDQRWRRPYNGTLRRAFSFTKKSVTRSMLSIRGNQPRAGLCPK